MHFDKKRPRVGIATLVLNQRKILLGRRIGSHGALTYGLPGGHLEFNEHPFDGAKRELLEETSLEALELEKGPWVSAFFEESQQHYISLFVLVKSFKGTPRVLEPEKCESWDWYDLNHLPSPLFLPLQHFMDEEKNYLKSIVI